MKLKQLLNETVNYPTQEDAEAVLELVNALNNISFSTTSKMVSEKFRQIEEIRRDLVGVVVGDNSPWSFKRSGNKIKLIWDKEKAKNIKN